MQLRRAFRPPAGTQLVPPAPGNLHNGPCAFESTPARWSTLVCFLYCALGHNDAIAGATRTADAAEVAALMR